MVNGGEGLDADVPIAGRGLLTVVDIAEDRACDLDETDLALIRPDQIVAGRGNRWPDDAAALFAKVTGH